MASKIKFVYFDIGGVLVDWSRVFSTPARLFGITSDDISRVFGENKEALTKGFMTAPEYWEKCIEKYDLKNAHSYDFLQAWVGDYRPITETHAFVKDIKPRYKIGLLSNIYKGMLPFLLKTGAIPKIAYDQIVFSCDVGMMKPNLDIYELAAKRAGESPENILLVDDRQDYLDGAKRAGFQTFMFDEKHPEESVRELEKLLQGSTLNAV